MHLRYKPAIKVFTQWSWKHKQPGAPFYSAEYEMDQLTIPAKLQKNISYDFFSSGHMIYLNPKVLEPLHDRVAKFIESNYEAQ